MKLVSKYSEAITPLMFGVLLLLTVIWGQGFLGDKADVAVLAALTTLFGVSLNHLVQIVGQRKREKDKREFEIRRDIYLEFAEGIAKNWARLSKLLRFDIEEKELQASANDFVAAGNKVRIVGSAKTVECFEQLFAEFAKFELSIRQDRLGINARISEIRQIDEAFRKNQETMTQINTYLQNLKPSGMFNTWTDQDNTQIQNMRQQFGSLNNQNTALVATRATHSQELLQVEIDYRKKYIRGIASLRPITTEMMLSVRAELGVDIDEDWYRRLSEAQDKEMRQEFERVIEESAHPKQTLPLTSA